MRGDVMGGDGRFGLYSLAVAGDDGRQLVDFRLLNPNCGFEPGDVFSQSGIFGNQSPVRPSS